MTVPSPSARFHRLLATVAAAIGWCALLLQLALSIQLSLQNGRSAGWGVFMYFGYFTVLSNLLVAVALTAAAGAWRGTFGAFGTFGDFWRRPGTATALAASIAIVGLVYLLVLRFIWEPKGLLLLADVLLHYVMPSLYLLYWWLAVPKRGLGWRALPWWWSYPLGYLVYALVRGSIAQVYPYPFIDVGALGGAIVARNALGILIGYSAVALLLIAAGRFQSRKEAD